MPRQEPYGQVKLKGILFGDDNWGTVIDEEPAYKNSKGIVMKRYLVNPGEHLVKQYPQLQKEGALTYKGYALWVEYPTYWINDENPSRTNAIVRIDCGFDGRETSQTKRVKKYVDDNSSLQEENENLKISNLHLMEENRMLLGEKKKMMMDFVELNQIMKGDRHGTEDSGED